MKSQLLLAVLTMTSSLSVFASSNIKDFVGHYELLQKQEAGASFCYKGVQIKEEGGMVNLYRSDMTEYGPVISSKLNGGERLHTSSHGEAMTTTKYKDTVKMKDNTLIFSSIGSVKLMGFPIGSDSEISSFTLSTDKTTLKAERTLLENFKSSKATCSYKKLN